MRLILCEMKKVFKGPMVWIALVIAIAVNIVQIISGSAAPVLSTDIQELKDRYAYFAGPITSEWSQRYQQEADQILTDPQYQVSEEEAEAIIQKYVNEWGYTEETVRDNGALFLNEAGVTAHEKYEDVTVAANFYKYAMDFGEQMAQYYGDTYPGEKGEAFADYTLERYTYLANEYVANYNYDFGYGNIRKIMTVYPYTLGLVVLVALAPIFSSEYSRRTDALLLTSKNGKKRLAHGKLAAGLWTGVILWSIITVLNVAVIFCLYGTAGWEAFWQDWISTVAPFPWNQGIATVAAIFTSLLGTLFFVFILMLVSSISKNQFVSIIIGAVILLFPVFDFGFTGNYAVQMIYNFLPSRMMMGERIWQGFDLFYLAGAVIPYQYIAITFAVVASICTIPVTTHLFVRHQVEN